MSDAPGPGGRSAGASVSVLAGAIQQYAWGRVDALAAWVADAPVGAHAELWFGAHPNGPSPIVAGPQVATEQAPLLVKLLAAASPLSIQVHPDADGVSLLSARPDTAVLLADAGVKSEVLIALEDFDVLAGLRPTSQAFDILCAGLGQHPACALLATGDVIGAIRAILTGGANGPGQAQDAVVDTDAMLAMLPTDERAVMTKVVAQFLGDIGLPVAFMLQPRTLAPGQAMFVPAGSLHAYVDGFGLEVMSSSDNVLRLGLTPKEIAVEAALSITRANLQPVVVNDCAEQTTVDGIPFSVQRVTDGDVEISEPGSVALCVAGGMRVEGLELTLQPGQASLLHAGSVTARSFGDCYIARPIR